MKKNNHLSVRPRLRQSGLSSSAGFDGQAEYPPKLYAKVDVSKGKYKFCPWIRYVCWANTHHDRAIRSILRSPSLLIMIYLLTYNHLLDAPAATIIPYKPKFYFDQTMACCTREYDACMAKCTKGQNYCDRYCLRHRYRCVDTTYDCIDTCFVEEEYCLISTQGWIDNFFNTREIRCKRIKDNCLRTYCNITPL